jgi:Spy/CpxP family protein refolding chaperone
MNLKAVVSAAAFLSTVALSGAAFAQTTPVPAMPGAGAGGGYMMRGEHGSNTNVRTIHRRLERLIDQLQHDRHDYGGHREKAVDLLQQARAELNQAIQYDKDHPGT